ncbi:hypothetical protein K3495_g8000, partial [Podosphaera aphanis]
MVNTRSGAGQEISTSGSSRGRGSVRDGINRRATGTPRSQESPWDDGNRSDNNDDDEHESRHSVSPALRPTRSIARSQSPPRFDPREYKLDGSVAMKMLEKKGFPSLDGPGNFSDWDRQFSKAMTMSAHIGFFDGTYELIPGAINTPWYSLGKRQAVEYLKESCSSGKEREIQDMTDPILAYQHLKASSKPIGNSHYCSLQRQFYSTSQTSCGSARDFKAAMLEINRKLSAMHPKYRKPAWEMNSWFINNLTDAYDHKVSSLSSNPRVIAVEDGMSFDDLCLEIIEEEERLTEKHGGNPTTVATATTINNPSDLRLRFKAISAELSKLRCVRCNKTGHADVVGEGGCFHNPANAAFKKAYENRMHKKRGRDNKRSGKYDKSRDESAPKNKKIIVEEKDFNQDQEIGVT